MFKNDGIYVVRFRQSFFKCQYRVAYTNEIERLYPTDVYGVISCEQWIRDTFGDEYYGEKAAALEAAELLYKQYPNTKNGIVYIEVDINYPFKSDCPCRHCQKVDEYGERWMIVCPECGNKRCPKASHHGWDCTNSNESGQHGSVWGDGAKP